MPNGEDADLGDDTLGAVPGASIDEDGKILRGIIRIDLSYTEDKATNAENGQWHVRYDHSVDRDEALQVTGGIRGALDSVVSTVNGRSVLLPSGAPLGRDLHNLNQMIGQVTDRFLVIHPPKPNHRC